jgi:GT2 family glycosyltransferase
MRKLSVIILNYCTKGLIEKNISNIKDACEDCEIIFVDNDSPDGSADFVKQKYGDDPNIILIQANNNGLAAGYNLGLERASGDYILYLGTDAFPTKGAIAEIIDYMDHNPDVGVSTAKLYTRDGKLDMDAHRSFPTPWVALTHMFYLDRLFPKSKLFNKYSIGYLDLDSIHEIDACISHFMVVRSDVHKKIGKWDESYWLYGEDIDHCYRVKQAGFKVMYIGTAKVLHYKGASVGRDTSKDIDNALNTDFDRISFKNEKVEKKKEVLANNKNRSSVSSTKLWMKVRVVKESTQAMKTFYLKHYIKKYPPFVTRIVLFGIWVNEKIRIAKIILQNLI